MARKKGTWLYTTVIRNIYIAPDNYGNHRKYTIEIHEPEEGKNFQTITVWYVNEADFNTPRQVNLCKRRRIRRDMNNNIRQDLQVFYFVVDGEIWQLEDITITEEPEYQTGYEVNTCEKVMWLGLDTNFNEVDRWGILVTESENKVPDYGLKKEEFHANWEVRADNSKPNEPVKYDKNNFLLRISNEEIYTELAEANEYKEITGGSLAGEYGSFITLHDGSYSSTALGETWICKSANDDNNLCAQQITNEYPHNEVYKRRMEGKYYPDKTDTKWVWKKFDNSKNLLIGDICYIEIRNDEDVDNGYAYTKHGAWVIAQLIDVEGDSYEFVVIESQYHTTEHIAISIEYKFVSTKNKEIIHKIRHALPYDIWEGDLVTWENDNYEFTGEVIRGVENGWSPDETVKIETTMRTDNDGNIETFKFRPTCERRVSRLTLVNEQNHDVVPYADKVKAHVKKEKTKTPEELDEERKQKEKEEFLSNYPREARDWAEKLYNGEINEIDWNQVEVKHHKHKTIKKCIECKLPIYLSGPAGSGKSHVLETIAKELDMNFYFANSIQDEFKLIGYKDAHGTYHDTQFYRACTDTKPCVFFLDELDASDEEVLTLLNTAIANKYFVFPDGEGRHDISHVNFVSAGNTMGNGADDLYTGRRQLDQATLDRFAIIEFDYDKDIEFKLSEGNDELCKFVRDLREKALQLGIRTTFSYRCIQMATSLLKTSLSLKEIIKIAIVKGLDDETLNVLNVDSYETAWHKEFEHNVKEG